MEHIIAMPSEDDIVGRAMSSCIRAWPSRLPTSQREKILGAVASEKLCLAAERARILHVVRHVLGLGIEGPIGDTLLWLHDSVARKAQAIHNNEWPPVHSEFIARGIVHALLKGFRVSCPYPGAFPVFSNDVDVLIRPDDVPQVREAMQCLGFSQDLWIHEGRLRRLKSDVVRMQEELPERYGKLWPFCRVVDVSELLRPEECHFLSRATSGRRFVLSEGGAVFVMTVDIRYDVNPLSAANYINRRVSLATLWEGAYPVRYAGTEVLALPASTMSWLLPFSFYFDTILGRDRSAKSLGDIVLLARSGMLDYDSISRTVEHASFLRPAIFYVFSFLADWAGLDIDTEWLGEFAEAPSLPGADLGDVAPHLLEKRLLLRLDQ